MSQDDFVQLSDSHRTTRLDPAATTPLRAESAFTQPLRKTDEEREGLIAADRRSLQQERLLDLDRVPGNSGEVEPRLLPMLKWVLGCLAVLLFMLAPIPDPASLAGVAANQPEPVVMSQLNADGPKDDSLPTMTLFVEGGCRIKLDSRYYRVQGAFPEPAGESIRSFYSSGPTSLKFQGLAILYFEQRGRLQVQDSRQPLAGILEVDGPAAVFVGRHGKVSVMPKRPNYGVKRVSCRNMTNLVISEAELVTAWDSELAVNDCCEVIACGQSMLDVKDGNRVSAFDSTEVYAQSCVAVKAADHTRINLADVAQVDLSGATSGVVSYSRLVNLFDRASIYAVNCEQILAAGEAEVEYVGDLTMVRAVQQSVVTPAGTSLSKASSRAELERLLQQFISACRAAIG